MMTKVIAVNMTMLSVNSLLGYLACELSRILT